MIVIVALLLMVLVEMLILAKHPFWIGVILAVILLVCRWAFNMMVEGVLW